MMAHGYAGQCGFSYQLDGLRNDLEALWEHMRAGNAALCNLRVGHIVALVDARETERGREYLVIDSYSESAHEKVKNAVREVVEASSITAPVRNAEGLEVGEKMCIRDRSAAGGQRSAEHHTGVRVGDGGTAPRPSGGAAGAGARRKRGELSKSACRLARRCKR